jgi:hypothetical protein
MQTTVKAMKRIAEIKARREHAFYKNRCVSFPFLSNLRMLNHVRLQYGSGPGKASRASQEDHAGEGVHQPRPTPGKDRSSTRTGEDQGCRQVKKCSHPWRRPLYGHGHGHRLNFSHPLASLISTFSQSHCSVLVYLSWGFRTIHHVCMPESHVNVVNHVCFS